jgi:hypothetical protein
VRTPRAVRVTAIVCGVALSLLTAMPAAGAATSATKPAKSAIATTAYAMPTSVPLADTAPPWALPADARPYIQAAGLDVLGEEQLEVHYHAHVDVIDASTVATGEKVTVPAGIGFVIQNDKATGITVLHTHDTSGVIHIESAKPKPYALGQVFTEWGVALSATQVGGLQNNAADAVEVFVNGRKFTGDPATIQLKKHLEIALWYGPTGTTPKVPKSYKFPAGL